MKNGKLLDALKVLKKNCIDSFDGTCDNCPLHDTEEGCLITSAFPNQWKPWDWLGRKSDRGRVQKS